MKAMTVFGHEVWVLSAKRGITRQRDLARLVGETSGGEVSPETVRNYLYGRSVVHHRFVKGLAEALRLDDEERTRLALVFAYHQDEEVSLERLRGHA